MLKDHINKVKHLRKREGRDQTGCTIVEGYPEIKRAVNAGVPIVDLYICRELIDIKPDEFKDISITEVSRDEFAAMAFGKRLKGILAICKPKKISLNTIKLCDNPKIIVLEGIEKPGNFGSVIRSADGAGFDLVVACDARTDVYNHHVVRSSIGTLFTVPIVSCTQKKLFDFLTQRNIKILVATAFADMHHYTYDMTQSVAIIVGNEHSGVSPLWQEKADVMIKIPMSGDAACLNVAHSASILMYEVLRQRTQK